MKMETAKSYGTAFLREAKSPKRLAKQIARQPIEAETASLISGLRQVEIADLVSSGLHQVQIADRSGRHAWSLGFAEQTALQLLVHERNAQNIFEIGTFNGATTRLLAECLSDEGLVVTIDLPDREFALTQSPDAFTAEQVGAAYESSLARPRIRQERGDSLTFDFSTYFGTCDLVLVDGAHDYEHGYADSRTAIQLARPGGIIVWDDFEPYWHGLVRGVLDATEGMPLGKLVGTSLAALETPGAGYPGLP